MKIKYRPEIDGLRAIAVAAVVLYHAQISVLNNTSFSGGFIGVDIFFVISGYLITSIILKELVTTGKFSFKYFYERRIRRLLPALLLVTIVSIPLAWVFLMPKNFLDFIQSVLYALGFTSNFYFLSGLEYNTDVGLSKPFLHTWSLSIEEQYYILFPIFLLTIFKYFRNYLGIIFFFIFLVSLGIADWGSKNYPKFNFYILPTRGWELIAGSFLSYLELKIGREKKYFLSNSILSGTGFLLIIHSIIFFNDEMFHPSFYTISPVIGVCLIIWFSNKRDFLTKLLSSKTLVSLGLISYSLYLWHYPIFTFLEAKFFYFYNDLKIIAILLSITISIISYIYVEKIARQRLNFKILLKIILFIYFIIFITLSYLIKNQSELINNKKIKYHHFLDFEKYDSEGDYFLRNYNYDNFDERKKVFIIGDSYSKDLLNSFNYNKELSKKYYFYIPSSKEYKTLGNYQLVCFLRFLKNNDTTCQNNDYTSHLKKQYEMSDYIIFANKGPSRYLERFLEINEFLKKDNKRFLVFLDDVRGKFVNNLNDLDRFVYIHNRSPNNEEKEFLEKNFYQNSMSQNVKKLNRIKSMFKNHNISFLTRSELYCDHKNKRCKMITKNDEKIYYDSGHLTNAGANFFSSNIGKIVEELSQ